MVGLIFVGGIARLAHFPLNWTIDLAASSLGPASCRLTSHGVATA
jgi:hypothetical protein